MSKEPIEKLIRQAIIEFRTMMASKVLELPNDMNAGREFSLLVLAMVREAIDFLFEFNKKFYKGTKSIEGVTSSIVFELLSEVTGVSYYEYTKNRAKVPTGSDKN